MHSRAVDACKNAAHHILWFEGKSIEYDQLKDMVDDVFRVWNTDGLYPSDCAGAYEYVKMLVSEASIEVHLPTTLYDEG